MKNFFDIITQNGESPVRVFLCSIVIILLFALGYFLMGFVYTSPLVTGSSGDAISVPVVIGVKAIIKGDAHHGPIVILRGCFHHYFRDCVYFSLVTFTTLGYGDLVPVKMTRILAVIEAYVGAFTIALFAATTFNRYTKRQFKS